jgi:hypothetical protein
MNKKGGGTNQTPSAWGLEVKRFKELYDKWLDYHLNKFFDLSVYGPSYRSIRIFFLRVGFVFVVFIAYLLSYSFLAQVYSQQTTLSSLIIVTGLNLIRLLLILWIPVFIAIEMAGNYITDIFELKDPSVAWKFIGEISLGGASEVLHIRDGKVAEEDKDSPIVLIGGPGRVEVEFDTAVLFEKPDGTPHVIGPVVAKSEEKDPAILEGFERLREPIINLRDQYFGYNSSDAIAVESRSLDGIPISAKDIRIVFSIHRSDGSDSQKPSKEKPFLYNPQSVQDLIYQQAVQVLQGEHPSGEPGAWTGTMRGMVSGEIGAFMSQNKLTEFLASISTPEIEAQEHREDTILLQTLRYSDQLSESESEAFTKPNFHPRTELTDRFMKYTDGFAKRANERGMDLHWIGVGTWKAPDEKINVRHREAWQVALENAAHSSNQALEQIVDEACLKEKLRLIKNVPLEAYKDSEGDLIEKEKRIEALLQNFWEQMGNVLNFYYINNIQNNDVDQLEKAILKIEKLLNIPGGQHMVGGGSLSKVKRRTVSSIDESSPPAPSSHDEVIPYRNLLALMTKLGIDHKAVEPMIENEARRHPTLTRKELIERIVKRLERYGK